MSCSWNVRLGPAAATWMIGREMSRGEQYREAYGGELPAHVASWSFQER